MAQKRSLAQIFAWFKTGAEPTQAQFEDTFSSFFHKDEKIPLPSVDGLPEALNGKYEHSEGMELEKRMATAEDFIDDQGVRFTEVYERLDEAEDRLDGHDTDIQTLRQDMTAGDAHTLAGAKLYTDEREAVIIEAADSKDRAVLQEAKGYTDTRETAILATADTKDATTLRSAKEYADSVVAALVDNSPEALNTLQELATALGNDPNFATTVMAAIGSKVDKVAGKGLSTNDYTEADRTKLAGITAGANNYVHPNDANTRHVTDSEKATWNAKETTTGAQAKANTALASAKTYADNLVSALVDGCPASLDTLVKLAAAIGNDPNFATTVMAAIGNKVDKIAGKGLSTNDYTEADRTKLAGITAGANNYVHPNDANTRHVTDSEKATWNAKETTAGAQAKADAALASAKTYVDAQVGGSAATVDSALSTTSTNAVQNKVITAALNAKQKQLVPATLTYDGVYLQLDGNSHLVLLSERTAGLEVCLDSMRFQPGDQAILEISGNTPVSFFSPEGGSLLQPLSFADLTPESGFTIIYTIVKSIGMQWVVTKDKYSTKMFDHTGGGNN